MSSLNANQKRCLGVWPNEEISYTNASVSGFLSLITIPGNLLVLIVVFKNPNGKMRTPFNWFILNLALADLLVGMIVEPLSVIVHAREGLGYPLKYHVYLQPVYFTSCTASVFSLGMLTIDRYIAITSPMHYRATLSNRRAAISSLAVWIISTSPPFLQQEIGFLWYFFVFGNASVLVTFFVLLFAFVRVHLTLRAQIRELESIQGRSEENQARNNALKTEGRITKKTFMFMLLAFIFCYTLRPPPAIVSDQKVPLVLTFHPFNFKVRDIVNRNFNLLKNDPETSSIFSVNPLVSFRHSKNIRETLVRSSLRQDSVSPAGTFSCHRRRCNTCQHIDASTIISAPKTQFIVKHSFTCISSNLIYCISCSKCSMLYIGETGRRLGDRFAEHLRDVKHNTHNKPVARHFNSANHSFSDMKVCAIHPINTGGNDIRKREEKRLIFKLGTVNPHGLNERLTFT